MNTVGIRLTASRLSALERQTLRFYAIGDSPMRSSSELAAREEAVRLLMRKGLIKAEKRQQRVITDRGWKVFASVCDVAV